MANHDNHNTQWPNTLGVSQYAPITWSRGTGRVGGRSLDRAQGFGGVGVASALAGGVRGGAAGAAAALRALDQGGGHCGGLHGPGKGNRGQVSTIFILNKIDT